MWPFKRKSSQDSIIALQQVAASMQTLTAVYTELSKIMPAVIGELQAVQGWNDHFHKLLLNDAIKGPTKKVYGLVYKNKTTPERRLILAGVQTFEQATVLGTNVLGSAGFNPNDYEIELYQSVDLPHEFIADNLELKKPVQSFINELQLARDRFTSTATEKNVFNKVITRVKDEYATK